MKKIVSLLILSVSVMLLIFGSHGDLRAHAVSIPLISFSESSYLVAVNKPFNVTVMLQNVSDLAAWQIGVLFDPSAMQYVTSTVPTDNIYDSRVIVVRGTDFLGEGLVVIGGEHLPLDPAFTGAGKIVTITFIMNTTGTAALAFDISTSGSEHNYTFLLNSKIDEMIYSVAGCYVRSIQYVPDVNNDGIVDMKDISSAVMAFNSFPNTSRWNVYADVDNNGRVDMRDIVLVVANFGMHTSGTPSGGTPGIEKLDFTGTYAETTTDGWDIHLEIKDTGSVPASFDNSRVFADADPISMFPVYTSGGNFSQVTLQPGDAIELQIMLPSSAYSLWQPGWNLWMAINTFAGNYYIEIITLP